jgi:hypothetical protein
MNAIKEMTIFAFVCTAVLLIVIFISTSIKPIYRETYSGCIVNSDDISDVLYYYLIVLKQRILSKDTIKLDIRNKWLARKLRPIMLLYRSRYIELVYSIKQKKLDKAYRCMSFIKNLLIDANLHDTFPSKHNFVNGITKSILKKIKAFIIEPKLTQRQQKLHKALGNHTKGMTDKQILDKINHLLSDST